MKKIYLEITNNCNLNCNFCLKNNRKKENMSLDDFKLILPKLKGYTNYLYFHVYGEPLMNPNINSLIDYASKDFKINITTNGYLINKIKNNKNIRQVNISLHSYDSKYKVSISDYLNNIINSVNSLKEYTFISYRIWVNNSYTKEILDYISNYYSVSVSTDSSIKLDNNVYLDFSNEFIWPELSNSVTINNGTCYGLRDHIGILVDGTIVPCCLDTRGIINLGNIYNDSLDDVLNSKRVINMVNGFKCNKRVEELCKKCNFLKNKK